MSTRFRFKWNEKSHKIEPKGEWTSIDAPPYKRTNPKTGKTVYIVCCGHECAGPLFLKNRTPKRNSRIRPYGVHMTPQQIREWRKQDPKFSEDFPHFDLEAYKTCGGRGKSPSGNERRPATNTYVKRIKQLVAAHIDDLRELADQIFDVKVSDKFFLRFLSEYVEKEGWLSGTVEDYPLTFFSIASAIDLWGFKCKPGSELSKIIPRENSSDVQDVFLTASGQIKTGHRYERDDRRGLYVLVCKNGTNSTEYKVEYSKRWRIRDSQQTILHVRLLTPDLIRAEKWQKLEDETKTRPLEDILADLKNKGTKGFPPC